MKSTFTTEVIKKINPSFIEEWQDLWKRAEYANVFNSYEWFLTVLEAEKDKSYEIYACYENNKLVAVLPLHKFTIFGIPVLGPFSLEHLVDTPFLAERYDRALFKHFFEPLFKKNNIYLQKVDSKAAQVMKKSFPGLFFTLMSVNPVINLNEDLQTSISPSTLKQMKKIIKNNADKLRFEVNDGNLPKYLQTMFALEQKSSKRIRSMDIFSKQENRIFYKNIVKNCGKLVRICFLYFDNLPIAYQYGYLQKDVFVCDQIAYRNEYSKLRPGKTILYFLIDYLKKASVAKIDLGGGISTYKTEFTKEYRLLYNVYYSPNKLIMEWWKFINTVRRTKQIYFPLKNTKDHEFLFKPLQD